MRSSKRRDFGFSREDYRDRYKNKDQERYKNSPEDELEKQKEDESLTPLGKLFDLFTKGCKEEAKDEVKEVAIDIVKDEIIRGGM